MRIALTGTPGVGKTTIAALAAPAMPVIDLKQWAKDLGAVVDYDAEDAADVIDLDVLANALGSLPDDCLIEGHMAHLIGVDVACVIRVDPDVLRPRLEARGYRRAKIQENLEAEALDLILQEALDEVPLVIQRDGTRRSPSELWQAFADSIGASLKAHDIEAVDWSHRLPI